MELSFLKKLISKAPTGPGIYIFIGLKKEKSRFVSRKARLTNRGSSMPAASGLYIGKASSLKARLSSYLKTTDDRILQMLSRATGIKVLETGSEIEALILESQYVKKYKPVFNIMLRDDKQFFYVGFTNDMFSKLFLTHQPTKVSSIKYQVLRGQKSHNTKYVIHNTDFIGPFTDGAALKTTLRYLRRIFPYCTCKKPHNNFCLNYHIGKCYGICCLKNPVSSIRYQVLREYKKNIRAIKEILSGEKESLVKNLERGRDQAAKNGDLEKAIELRDRISKLKKVLENARIIHNTKYLIHNTKSGTKSQNALKELARLLKLSHVQNRIEGYDVSNIQGKYAVGVMVVFTRSTSSGQANYKPNKNEYRRFKIYTKQSPDDTAMLKEILIRRFNHPEWPMPDLILIDGGKAQLNVARSVITELLNYPITVLALTKNKKHKGEKIFIAGRAKPIPFSQLPTAAKNLLLQVDAEAHRFAISYYRKLHRKNLK